uniref:Uncharacterized protein n=1 Tax=Kalanchoe fedtschenkoi TaxID=63787 RepID=A0A7N0RGY1_KALFE
MDNEEEDDGGFEEYEVERGWSLKRLLKLWFVMVAVGLSTLYVSSMNSPSVGLEDEYWVVGSDLNGAPFSYENASGSVIHDEIAKMGFEEASHRIVDEIVFRDYDNDIVETTGGNQEEDLGEVSDDETMVADQIEATEDGVDSELTEVAHYASGEAVAEDAGGTVDDELVNVEEAAPEDHDEVAETVETQSQIGEASNVEMDGVADANAHNDATPEVTAVSEHSTGEELEAGDREVESSGALSKSGSDESLNNLYEAEVSEVSDPGLVDELIPTFTEGTNKAMSVVFALLLALFGALGFQKLKRTTKPLVGKAVGVAEQDASIGQCGVKQLDPSEKTSQSQSFKSGLGAPRAELLSEFTVGEQEVSSYSLRTDCVDNCTYSFSQENMRMSAKLHAARTPVDSHPSASGFSSTTDYPPYGSYSSQRRRTRKELPTSSVDSRSYGSFTTELILRKKEEAPGLEKVVVTPVRRSSRIRGRMTPGSSQ